MPNLKRLVAPAAAAALAVSALSAGPARAAGPYTIHNGASNGPTLSVVVNGFAQAKCDPALLADPFNGSDARIVDVAALGLVNRAVAIAWTPAVGTENLAYLSSAQTVFDGSCNRSSVTFNQTHARGGFLNIPAGARWLAVTAVLGPEIQFTLG
jgi:hypothetical protein